MTSRVGLIGLASLAGLALSISAADARTTRSTGVVFSDIIITSSRAGRVVATTRTDRQGDFRLALPAGAYDICLDGPGLRSAITPHDDAPEGPDNIIGVLIGLLLPAVQNTTTSQELAFPRARSGGPGRHDTLASPRPARNVCFSYTVRVAVGDLTGDGTADRRVDPRIPPPAARSRPAGPAASPTVVVAGTVSLVR